MSENSTPFNHPWPEDIIDNVATVTVGGTPSTDVSSYWGGQVPWMASGDIHLKRIFDVPQRISELGLRHSNARLVDPPCVAIALAGQGKTRGTAALVLCRLCTNQSVALISPKTQDVVAEYLFLNLQFRYDELRSRSAGGGRAGLTKRLIQEVPVPLPPRPEQEKIAEALATLDRAIEDTELLIAKQERIKKGLMQDLLTRGLDEHGKVRCEKTHTFKNSAFGRIPEEWRTATVGDMFESRRERGKPGLPVMSIVMNDGLVKRSSVDRRVESNLPAKGHALVLKDDIAYNMMRMWQGVLGRAPFDCLISPAYVVLKPKEIINTHFAEWLFRDERSILKFRRASRGVVDDRLRLYTQDLFPIEFAIPTSLDEQEAITQRLDLMKSRIGNETTVLAKLRRLRLGLMQDLLTGRKRVTPLLKAIRQSAGQTS